MPVTVRGSGSMTITQRFPIALVLVATAAILIAPLLIFSIWEGVNLAKRERDEITERTLRIAQEVRADIDRTLTYHMAILNTLSGSPELDSGDLEELHSRSGKALRPLGLFVLLRDLTGQQLFNTRVPFGTKLPRETGFDDPLLETKQPYVSDIITGAVAQKSLVGLSVPVMRDRELRFILTLSLAPKLFADLLEKIDLPTGWIINLVDRQGVRIARSDQHEDFVGVAMPPDWRPPILGKTILTQDANNNDVQSVAVQSEISDWKIVVSTPESAIAGRVSQALNRFIIITLIFAIISLLFAYLLGRAILKSFRHLTRNARDFGDHKPISIQPSRLREVHLLSQTLETAAIRRDADEAQIRLLMHELNHRLKNLLTLVQVFVSRTQASDIETFQDQLIKRIQGLAVGQDLILKNSGKGVDLLKLGKAYKSIFESDDSDRFNIEGSSINVSSDAAQALGLAFHELGTNATKYGALAKKKGTVKLEWKIEGNENNRRFRMSWQEQDGPPVKSPDHSGFGHKVIIEQIESALNANVQLDFLPDGIKWSVDAPLKSVSAN